MFSKTKIKKLMKVLAIFMFFIFIFAVFIIYPRIATGRPTTNNTSILNSAAAQINSLFPDARYGKLTNVFACKSDVFPDNFKLGDNCMGGQLVNEWGGRIYVSGVDLEGNIDTSNNAYYYQISYPKVPSEVCKNLAPSLAANFGVVRVNDTEIINTYDTVETNNQVNESEVTQACLQKSDLKVTVIGK